MNVKIEKMGPLYMGILVFIVLCFIPLYPKDISNVSDILSNVVNFVSIITGFLTTTISILITITNTKVMKRIIKAKRTSQLTNFFSEPIFIGVILVIVSLVGIGCAERNDEISKFLLNMIVSLLIYFIFLFFRVATIAINILKEALKEKNNKNDMIEPDVTNLFNENNKN